MELQIIASSSSGNVSLLTTPETAILIDAGLSGKRILEALKSIEFPPERLEGVLISHEHSDHTAGLRGLAKFEHLKFFANRDTASAAQKKLPKPLKWHIFETGSTFQVNDLAIQTFAIPHDAYDPVGFVFSHNKETLGWLTDLGYIPQGVAEIVRHVDRLLIESNYDEDLLDANPKRPWSLKQRIKSRHGHLSNNACFEFLQSSTGAKWKEVFLAHISKDCNCLEKIHTLFEPLNQTAPFDVTIIDPNTIPFSQSRTKRHGLSTPSY